MAAEAVVPVSMQGFSIGSVVISSGVWTAVLVMIGYIIRQRPQMKALHMQEDARVDTVLLERISKQDERINSLEGKLEEERVNCAAELRALRHQVNNSNMSLDALLLLLEVAPDKASGHVAKIKEMRAQQKIAEATEKGIIASAKIHAAKIGGIE